jgi:hypothetical protein
MTKSFRLFVPVLLICVCTVALHAQSSSRVQPPAAAAPAPVSLADIDPESAKLAVAVGGRLTLLRYGSPPVIVRIADFSMGEHLPPLGILWAQNLAHALSNLTAAENRGWTLIHDHSVSAVNYIISGEIIQAGQTVRVFTRIIKADDHSLIASWTTDLQAGPLLDDLLVVASSSGTPVRRDDYEPDSKEQAAPCEIGAGWISRTFHSGDDEDWFSVTADRDGFLILETAGSQDTVMKLYKAGTSSLVEEDDDGGDEMNARIECYVKTGESYIVSVTDYDNATGPYRFRATLQEGAEVNESEPNDTREQATPLDFAASSIRARFGSSDDTDWYKFTIPQGGGRFTVYTEGGKDTVLTLFNAAGEQLAEDDDSGSNTNAKIVRDVSAGTIYVQVTELDNKTGLYTLHFSLEK